MTSTRLRFPTPSRRRWHCLSVSVPHEAVEAVANFLVELGSAGVVEGVPAPAQPQPSTTEIQGFFPLEASGPALSGALTHYLAELAIVSPGLVLPAPRLTEVSSDAWEDCWREHFPPL